MKKTLRISMVCIALITLSGCNMFTVPEEENLRPAATIDDTERLETKIAELQKSLDELINQVEDIEENFNDQKDKVDSWSEDVDDKFNNLEAETNEATLFIEDLKSKLRAIQTGTPLPNGDTSSEAEPSEAKDDGGFGDLFGDDDSQPEDAEDVSSEASAQEDEFDSLFN